MHCIKKCLLSMVALGLLSTPNLANAHLMVADHGTLNFVDNNVFIVLSIPMSAFKGVDENKDGKVSIEEFNAHKKQISKRVKKNVYLADHQYKFTIDGLLLNPEASHKHKNTNIDQITITGRYSMPTKLTKVNFNVKLFSNDKHKQRYQITATNKKQKLTHQFDLTPTSPLSKVF
ncbi:hypothetical protein [Pseudoalteromonas sp. Z9A5]|uniref:hypothetical protein n=1 Tax=Pseudoalteromonas sp. Z9A5 TaxID=2686355 RepID=UPI00140DBA47|nr:hypothetical protein [Pseudoalteromonas sp. Z9A5]